MSDRYKPKEENLYSLRQTILGFCSALEPPKVYLPSQRGNRYAEATEIHERCHATLIHSTIYGISEMILTYLLKTGCPHIGQQILNQALNNCIKNSFIIHEGCATLCGIGYVERTQPENIDDFKATIDDDYLYALSRLSTAVDLFDFRGYLRGWLAIQIAAVCLCPPLFGPLSDYDSYKKGRVISIFEDENLSPDIRLEKIISDGKRGKLSKLIKDVKNVIEDSIQKTFPSSRKPDFDDDTLRYNFITICEPMIEDCFAETYPKFYVNHHIFLKEWKIIWPRIVSEFQEAGCSCLSHFSFNHDVDLFKERKMIRPVAIPERKGHPGAIKLDKLSDLPIQKNDKYYIGLCFNEGRAEIVCYNPLRLLHEGHLYVRFQRFRETEGSFHFENFYWFKFFTPSEISDALTSIAKIPGIVICSICGYNKLDRVIARLKECNRCSIRNIYLQIDGITVEEFLEDLIKVLPSPTYEMVIMREEIFGDLILFLKDTLCNFHAILPVPSETLIAIVKETTNLEKIEKRRAKPESADEICSCHLSAFGW